MARVLQKLCLCSERTPRPCPAVAQSMFNHLPNHLLADCLIPLRTAPKQKQAKTFRMFIKHDCLYKGLRL